MNQGIIMEITKDKVIDILKNNQTLGQGTNGIIKMYDSNTLIKLYYKEFFDSYCNLDPNKLEQEIMVRIEIETELKNIVSNYISSQEILKQKIIRLQKTKSNTLIKEMVTYQGYLIGILLTYYKDYQTLTKAIRNLSIQEKKIILQRIQELLMDLMEKGIYCQDLKEDNIMVRSLDLDIKLIDLDGLETRCEELPYHQQVPYLKQNCLGRLNDLNKRILKK